MKKSRHLARGWRILTVALLGVAGLTACAEGDMAEDEVEPAVDPEVSVATEEGVADVAYFTDWDMDDDTYLSEEEFGAGWESQTLWEDWDTDADSYLDQEEFDAEFGDHDWYEESFYADWDMDDDDLLAEDEFTTGLFGTWDFDDDDLLAENEFDTTLF